MNYRHIYHAGNRCDVIKHAALALLIGSLRGKEAGFCVLDTHAGTGLYDLQDAHALKTGEAQNGVLKLLAAKPLPELESYYSVLQKLNPEWKNETGFRFYPGSPLLAYHLLRPQDRLIACELHEEDARELQRHLRHHKEAQVHHRDGYESLCAFLPPHEKRGLVLIDPPYEETNEFDRLIAAMTDAHKRWPQGIFMIWYPVKERPAIWRFHEALAATGIPKQLCAEFVYEEEVRADRLNGCGLIIINPPWQTDEKLRHLFPALHEALETGHRGSAVKWLTGE
jgi:23S rRNA (adenine2030-N6)-methyltransferase